jgi:N-ethylmaleimide reductase
LMMNRVGSALISGPFAAQYYTQRAIAGLVIAEANQISAQVQGSSDTAGCYTDAQVSGWRQVPHTSFQRNGQAAVGPSAMRATTKTFIAGQGCVDVFMPQALEVDEINGIVEDFRYAASRAVEAGFDDVELHGARGYLLDVTEAVIAEIGADRAGVRLFPVSPVGDSKDSDPQPLFEYVVEGLDEFSLAYVHVVEGATGGSSDFSPFNYVALRNCFEGAWMVNSDYSRQVAMDAIASSCADLVPFGRLFMANPDLVRPFTENAPLNTLIGIDTIYDGGAHGYSDHPKLEGRPPSKIVSAIA